MFMFSPLRIFWAGHEAVMFFFVLSGFVLALPFFGTKPAVPYPLYLAKRILRIYSPYIVAALVAMGLREVLYKGDVGGVSGWFNQSWKVSATPEAIGQHLLMIGSFNNSEFNPVLWSLVHEMRISIVFPLIALGLVRHQKIVVALPILFTTIYWLAGSLNFRGIMSFDHDYFATLHYSGFFILGSLLAKYRKGLVRVLSAASRSGKLALLSAAVLAYTNPFWFPYIDVPGPGWINALFAKRWFHEWITAGGVAVFMLLAIMPGVISRVLRARPLVFLGAISYSLYLFHAVILKALVTLAAEEFPLGIVLLCVVPVALVAAAASWRWIEVPSIRLGKSISAWWYRHFPETRTMRSDKLP
ncbi:hypothetical protein Hhel01_01652 [Haloferula helveola]